MIHTPTVTPLFATQRPALEQGMRLTATAKSISAVSRAGLDQRIAHGARLRYALEYTALRQRAARQTAETTRLLELTTSVWVPFWPMRALTTTTLAVSGNVVSISLTPNREFFAPGDWVYLYERAATGAAQYRQVASVAGQALTLVALGGSLGFAIGTPIAPARLCIRTQGQLDNTLAHDASEEELLSYATL